MNKNNVDALVEKRDNTQPPTVECSQGSVIINIGNKRSSELVISLPLITKNQINEVTLSINLYK